MTRSTQCSTPLRCIRGAWLYACRHGFRRSPLLLLVVVAVSLVIWSLRFSASIDNRDAGSRGSGVASAGQENERSWTAGKYKDFRSQTNIEDSRKNVKPGRRQSSFNDALSKKKRRLDDFRVRVPSTSTGSRDFPPNGGYLQPEVNESFARDLVDTRERHALFETQRPLEEETVDFSDSAVKDRLDLRRWRPRDVLPNFKNPCWREKSVHGNACRKLPVPHFLRRKRGVHLRCLPYFFLIGQPKCGTSDIFFRLALHPQVAPPPKKEIFWLDKRRFEPGCIHVNTYLDYLGEAARRIDFTALPLNGSFFHPLVTGDGTPDVMWDNHFWWRLPGNENCSEPCLTNADLLHQLQPRARLVVALRHPADRLYSDYLYESQFLGYVPSPRHFHLEVLKELAVFRACVLQHSLRACVYNGTEENYKTSKVRLRIGLYSVHVADWLRVFPRNQMHVIKFEDYVRDLRGHLQRLFTFLELTPLPYRFMAFIASRPPVNQRHMGARALGDMLPVTRAALRDFYRPYNARLADVLRNPAFLWEDSPLAVT